MTQPALDVVHIGSACRDLTDDDPRGWRLGGGATYAALTTARLGLRTGALVGVDASAAPAAELDMLRAAGVVLELVPLTRGRYSTIARHRRAVSRPPSPRGVRCPSRACPSDGAPHRPGRWFPLPGSSTKRGWR